MTEDQKRICGHGVDETSFSISCGKLVFVAYVNVIDMSMIPSQFLSCNIMYKDIMLGEGEVGVKDE